MPTAGKVRLDGTELRNWDRRQFGEYTGYLPQEVELFPGTIKQNVCRMRDDLPDESIYEAAMLTGIHDMVCQLPNGYETVLERGGAPLSGGQKQRIALARAFFGNPSLVVLDEPNSNLDAAGEQALTETLRAPRRRGVTVVVVTLRPGAAEQRRQGPDPARRTRRGIRAARTRCCIVLVPQRRRRDRRREPAAGADEAPGRHASQQEARMTADPAHAHQLAPQRSRQRASGRSSSASACCWLARRLRRLGRLGAAQRRGGRLWHVRRHRPEQAGPAPRGRHHSRDAGEGGRSGRGRPDARAHGRRRRRAPSCGGSS